MTTRHLIPIALAALALAPSWGCDERASVKAEVIPVKGKVTYKGQPLTKGLISFEPRNSGRTASGEIQPDGTFVLGTFAANDGAVPGKHRISVSGTSGGAAGLAASKKPKEAVPAKYLQPNTSGVEVELSPEKADITIDLP